MSFFLSRQSFYYFFLFCLYKINKDKADGGKRGGFLKKKKKKRNERKKQVHKTKEEQEKRKRRCLLIDEVFTSQTHYYKKRKTCQNPTHVPLAFKKQKTKNTPLTTFLNSFLAFFGLNQCRMSHKASFIHSA
eukprot:TRINITY_DN7555_c4_g1_i1.p1 TRINITY_DN7555_c4_g1~~TRINITY_DN7555_c4_g1_i1.p1  ORF type:complete len:132 (+),score=12.46 TRINITY_DN7555_c4_g1_i1:690-1085(+)